MKTRITIGGTDGNSWFDLSTAQGYYLTDVHKSLVKSLGGPGEYKIVRTPRGRYHFAERYPDSMFFNLYRDGRKVMRRSIDLDGQPSMVSDSYCGDTVALFGLDQGQRFNIVRVR